MNRAIEGYQESNPKLWHGREDAHRFYQQVICNSLDKAAPKPGIGLMGFCSDEGVHRNQGRVGAKEGPDALRQSLGQLATHNLALPLYDYGNIQVGQDLEKFQAALGQAVAKIQEQHQMSVVLGGGHETAWGHYQGLMNQNYIRDLAIINFDAHFDLRMAQISTSGTPFAQISEHCQKQGIPFQYYCFGIQPQSNTKVLFDYAKKTNTQFWLAESIFKDPKLIASQLTKILQKHEAVYLSVCLDVFATAHAPGVSAPSPLGLEPWQVAEAVALCAQSKKVKAFDCVELAPNLDTYGATAKLGAQIIARFLDNL